LGGRFDRASIYAWGIGAHGAHIRDIHIGVEALDLNVGIAGIPKSGQFLAIDCHRPVVRRTGRFTSPAPGAFAVIHKNHLQDRIFRIGPCCRMDSELSEQDKRASPYPDAFYEIPSGQGYPFFPLCVLSGLCCAIKYIHCHRFSSMGNEVRCTG
jgi:hypothetical protein